MSQTPVWEVDGWSLENDFAKIHQQWDHAHDLLEDPTLYDLRDSDVSGWSCGEHAGHIALVTSWIASEIEQNLRAPERDSDGGWTEATRDILEQGDLPLRAWESPTAVHPVGRSRDDLLAALAEARALWKGLSANASLLPHCRARFLHFALGYMTSTEWVRFCAIHTAHHFAIVRDIRARRS